MPAHPTPDWERVEALLDQALDLDEAARQSFVSAICSEDPVTGKELTELLEAASVRDGPLDTPVAEHLGTDFVASVEVDPVTSPAIGRRIGSFRIVELLGRGGMGTVFLAERADGQFEQQVAVKLLRWDVPDDEAIQRFKAERQVLAVLEHPGIARLIDGGVTEEGLPYLVMERIDGLPIDEHCRVKQLDLRQRIELFRRVCLVVQFAHQNLIVHRDLKPSNILVTPTGDVKLLDFGIAKMLGAPQAPVTQTGSGPLTPSYAAPEQITGEPITTATDVYALGVLLYELLTGVRPHDADDPTPTELTRRILAEETALPSQCAAGQAAGEGGAEVPWAKALRGDLDSIALEALRRDPSKRYSAAAQLAEDLRRYLHNEPVSAHRATVVYRLGRFIRRHRVPVAAAALVLAAIGIGAGAAVTQARRALAESERAQTEAERAKRVSDIVTDLFGMADPFTNAPGGSVTARELLDRGLSEAERTLADDPATFTSLLTVIARGYNKLGLYQEGRALAERAVGLHRTLSDPIGLSTALAAQGDAESGRSRYEEADSLYREALLVRRLNGQRGSIEAARLLGAIANVQIELDDPDEALELNQQSLLILARERSDEDPEVLIQLAAKARIHRARGDYVSAVKLYEDVLARQRRTLDSLDEPLATTLNNLAYVRTRVGDHRGAQRAYRSSLRILEATAGPIHPSTLLIRRNLAASNSQDGRRSEAESLLVYNVERVRRDAPGDSRRLEKEISVLGGAYFNWGEFAKAANAFRETIRLLGNAPDATVPETAVQQLKLAMCLTMLDRHQEAAEVRQRATRDLEAGGTLNVAGRGQLAWIADRYAEHGRDELAASHRRLVESLTPESP